MSSQLLNLLWSYSYLKIFQATNRLTARYSSSFVAGWVVQLVAWTLEKVIFTSIATEVLYTPSINPPPITGVPTVLHSGCSTQSCNNQCYIICWPGKSPNCLQTTWASLMSQLSWHTALHVLLTRTSIRPRTWVPFSGHVLARTTLRAPFCQDIVGGIVHNPWLPSAHVSNTKHKDQILSIASTPAYSSQLHSVLV